MYFLGIFWELCGKFLEDFLGGIFHEESFGKNFLGEIFWEDFLGGILWEEFFGRNSLGGMLWEKFFV